MAQSISCLPHGPASLSSDLQHPYGKVRHGRCTSATTALGKGRVGTADSKQLVSSRLATVCVNSRRSWIKEDLMLTHGFHAHTSAHDHTNTYEHHVHIITWRRGYEKNLTETRIWWQNRNLICLPASPEGGHLPCTHVTRLGRANPVEPLTTL